MFTRVLLFASCLLVFSGCSIHPVPEDVTGVDTYHIVRQIRCESRQAVIDFIKRQLHRQADLLGDPIAQKLLEKYDRNPEAINNFKPDLFPGPDYIDYRRFYNLIYSAAIAYSFDLTMTEANNLTTTVDLLGPWRNKLMLGITGDANRTRTNERTFTITDTFQFLLANLNATDETGAHYCDGQIVKANYIYPIAGEIGVYKSVQTFFELSVLGGLSVDKAKPGQTGAPTMSDNLKFTTTVDLSGTPKVVFTPIGAAFQAADASLTGMVQRMDVHQVTVGLAIAPSGAVDVGPLRGFLFSGPSIAAAKPAAAPGKAAAAAKTPTGGPVVIGNRVTGAGATPAEKLAVLVIDQVKSREIILIQFP
jgi:hypothetical protein